MPLKRTLSALLSFCFLFGEILPAFAFNSSTLRANQITGSQSGTEELAGLLLSEDPLEAGMEEGFKTFKEFEASHSKKHVEVSKRALASNYPGDAIFHDSLAILTVLASMVEPRLKWADPAKLRPMLAEDLAHLKDSYLAHYTQKKISATLLKGGELDAFLAGHAPSTGGRWLHALGGALNDAAVHAMVSGGRLDSALEVLEKGKLKEVIFFPNPQSLERHPDSAIKEHTLSRMGTLLFLVGANVHPSGAAFAAVQSARIKASKPVKEEKPAPSSSSSGQLPALPGSGTHDKLQAPALKELEERLLYPSVSGPLKSVAGFLIFRQRWVRDPRREEFRAALENELPDFLHDKFGLTGAYALQLLEGPEGQRIQAGYAFGSLEDAKIIVEELLPGFRAAAAELANTLAKLEGEKARTEARQDLYQKTISAVLPLIDRNLKEDSELASAIAYLLDLVLENSHRDQKELAGVLWDNFKELPPPSTPASPSAPAGAEEKSALSLKAVYGRLRPMLGRSFDTLALDVEGVITPPSPAGRNMSQATGDLIKHFLGRGPFRKLIPISDDPKDGIQSRVVGRIDPALRDKVMPYSISEMDSFPGKGVALRQLAGQGKIDPARTLFVDDSAAHITEFPDLAQWPGLVISLDRYDPALEKYPNVIQIATEKKPEKPSNSDEITRVILALASAVQELPSPETDVGRAIRTVRLDQKIKDPQEAVRLEILAKYGPKPYAIAIRLGGTNLSIGLVNEEGEVETRTAPPSVHWRDLPEVMKLLGNPATEKELKAAILALIPVGKNRDSRTREQKQKARQIADLITQEAVRMAASLIRETGLPLENWRYIYGIVPAPTDAKTGLVGVPFGASNVPGFEAYPYIDRLNDEIRWTLGISVPGDAENDTPAGLKGEMSAAGTAAGLKNILYGIWGTGMNDDSDNPDVKLFETGHAVVGWISADGVTHYTLHDATAARPELAPGQFEVEQRLGGDFLIQNFYEPAGFNRPEDVTIAAREGNPKARALITEIGRDYGWSRAALLSEVYKKSGFLPSMYVIGSGVGEKLGKGVLDEDGRDLLFGAIQDAAYEELRTQFGIPEEAARKMADAIVRSTTDERREYAGAAPGLKKVIASGAEEGAAVQPHGRFPFPAQYAGLRQEIDGLILKTADSSLLKPLATLGAKLRVHAFGMLNDGDFSLSPAEKGFLSRLLEIAGGQHANLYPLIAYIEHASLATAVPAGAEEGAAIDDSTPIGEGDIIVHGKEEKEERYLIRRAFADGSVEFSPLSPAGEIESRVEARPRERLKALKFRWIPPVFIGPPEGTSSLDAARLIADELDTDPGLQGVYFFKGAHQFKVYVPQIFSRRELSRPDGIADSGRMDKQIRAVQMRNLQNPSVVILRSGPWIAVRPAAGAEETAKVPSLWRDEEPVLNFIGPDVPISPAVQQAFHDPKTWLDKYEEATGKALYPGTEKVMDLVKMTEEIWMNLLADFSVNGPATFRDEHELDVTPPSGVLANVAVQISVLKAGDTMMGLTLLDGGQMTEGAAGSLAKQLYKILPLPVTENRDIDYAALRQQLLEMKAEERPRLLLVGGTAFVYPIQFGLLRQIVDEVNADSAAKGSSTRMLFAADITQSFLQMLGGQYDSPIGVADIVTWSVRHQGGSEGGMILARKKVFPEVNVHNGDVKQAEKITLSQRVRKGVFPGTRAGYSGRAVLAKAALATHLATPEFRAAAQQIQSNARVFAEALHAADPRLRIRGSGEVHQVLVDVSGIKEGLTGSAASAALGSVGLLIPSNPFRGWAENPFTAKVDGLRFSVTRMTILGMNVEQFKTAAGLVAETLNHADPATGEVEAGHRDRIEKEVEALYSALPSTAGAEETIAAMQKLDELEQFWAPGVDAGLGLNHLPVLIDVSDDFRVRHLAHALSIMLTKDLVLELDFRVVVKEGQEQALLEELSSVNPAAAAGFLASRIISYDGISLTQENARIQALEQMAKQWSYKNRLELKQVRLVDQLTTQLVFELFDYFREGNLHFVSADVFRRFQALLTAA